MNIINGTQLGLQAHLAPVPVEKFEPEIRLRDTERLFAWRKPSGGLWTSTYTPDEEHLSEWVAWCVRENFYCGDHAVWLFTPTTDASVVQIDTYQDLLAFHNVYGLTNDRDYTQFDWSRVAEDFDAVNLTADGEHRTRFGPSGRNGEIDLYGWDCESTVWLKWKFSKVERVRDLSLKRRDYDNDFAS